MGPLYVVREEVRPLEKLGGDWVTSEKVQLLSAAVSGAGSRAEQPFDPGLDSLGGGTGLSKTRS